MSRTVGAIGKPCKVCGHGETGAIERLLQTGLPHRDIVSVYPGLTARDLQKHINDHMTVKPGAIAEKACTELEAIETARAEVVPTSPAEMISYMTAQLYRSSQRLSNLAELTGSVKAEQALISCADSYLRYAVVLANGGMMPTAPLEIIVKRAYPE